jgi:hypothetical protein
MGKPFHRMAADTAVTLRDVRPLGIFFQPEKDTKGPLVGAFGQYDFVTFAECGDGRFCARHFREPPSFSVLLAKGLPNAT